MSRLKFIDAVAIVAMLSTGVIAAPQFDGLPGGSLTDDLDSLLGPPLATESEQASESQKPSEAPPTWLPSRKSLDKMMRDSLDPNKQGQLPAGEDLGAGSPLVGIHTGMNQAKQLISNRAGTGETGQVQTEVVAKLDELIKKMEKQCKSCSNPSQSQANKPQQSKRSKPGKPSASKTAKASKNKSDNAAQRSNVRLSQADAKRVEGANPEEMMKAVWGKLPERLREQMLQSSSDEFLPEYRQEIEQYFQRLAEEPDAGK